MLYKGDLQFAVVAPHNLSGAILTAVVHYNCMHAQAGFPFCLLERTKHRSNVRSLVISGKHNMDGTGNDRTVILRVAFYAGPGWSRILHEPPDFTPMKFGDRHLISEIF